MKRSKCRACSSSDMKLFLDLGNMPLAGGFLNDLDISVKDENTYPLQIYVCSECSLVQILEVIDPETLFQNYSFSSSTVKPLINHFEDYAIWLKTKYNPNFVVEFGCNDGILLKEFNKIGVKNCGIDVSKNITQIARKEGLDVITGYFDESTSGDIKKRLGMADIVTGSNAFAHNDNPEKLIKAARNILNYEGHLCLEIMYAGDLLEMLQWDTLYHEHLTFYSLTTIAVLLKRYGFHVVFAERIPMHGGSLRICATMNEKEEEHSSVSELLNYESENLLTNPETWGNFGKNIGRKIGIVSKTLSELSKNSSIWGYGAAGKSTLWVNSCKMDYLEAMVDASPLRAGKFMPGTHTPIVFPEKLKDNPPDYIFVTAWNYVDAIKENEKWFSGVWITPLPDLRFF